jgi:hypothetical protein
VREADTAYEFLEPSVGSKVVERRTQQDGRVESRFIGLVQPDHRLIPIAYRTPVRLDAHDDDPAAEWSKSYSKLESVLAPAESVNLDWLRDRPRYFWREWLQSP